MSKSTVVESASPEVSIRAARDSSISSSCSPVFEVVPPVRQAPV
jgi:hypothetical protein